MQKSLSGPISNWVGGSWGEWGGKNPFVLTQDYYDAYILQKQCHITSLWELLGGGGGGVNMETWQPIEQSYEEKKEYEIWGSENIMGCTIFACNKKRREWGQR